MRTAFRCSLTNFYPRPPRGGRLFVLVVSLDGEGISIHALREEGDNCFYKQDTPPKSISIHALREEGDGTSKSASSPPTQFLSTPSARRATHVKISIITADAISIHALREEGDPA